MFKVDSKLVIFGLVVVVYFIAGCSSTPEPRTEPVSNASEPTQPTTGHLIRFSRYITIETCYRRAKNCIGPVAKEIEKANVILAMEPFAKSYKNGLTVVDEVHVKEEDLPFQGEIRISKTDDGYYVYMMLRSGVGTERHGRIKTFKIPDLSKLTEIVVEDDPITFKGGTLKAQLVMGPPLPLDVNTH